jgi:hypothetical protein
MDFRLFGGLRLTFSKQAYTSDINNLKERWKQFSPGPAGTGNQIEQLTPQQESAPQTAQPAYPGAPESVPLHTEPKTQQPSQESTPGSTSKPNQQLPAEPIIDSAPENI